MWDAVRLSLFEALQLIVATRVGDDAARSLMDFFSVAKLGLTRRDPTGVTMNAFEQARRDFEAWCRRGAIGAHGFRVIGPYGQVAVERTDLFDYWSSDAKFNYETSTILVASDVFKHITLRKADIERQVGVQSQVKEVDAPLALISAVGSAPPADGPFEHTSREQSAPIAKRRGRTPKYDWDAAEEAFVRRVRKDGWPEDLTNETGWQSQSNVESWVSTLLDNEPSESSVRKHVSEWLDRHRPERPIK